MLAQTFEIICSMRRNVIEAFALAFKSFTRYFFTIRIQILMIFKFMITKAFGLRTNHFTLNIFYIFPAQIQSIFTFLGNWQKLSMIDIKFFKFLQILFRNHSILNLLYNKLQLYLNDKFIYLQQFLQLSSQSSQVSIMANKKEQIDFSKLPISAESLTLICENKKTKQFATYIKLISDQVPDAQDAVSDVLNTILVRKKFSNQTSYVSALLLYKNVLVSAQMDYYQSQDLFPSQIHEAVAKICEYKGKQPLQSRGKTYFSQTFKLKQSQQGERLGTTAVVLALQIIQNMATWYQKDFFQQDKESRFKKSYNKLLKANVSFPQKGKYIVMKKQDQTNFKNNFDEFVRSNNTQNQTQEKNQSNIHKKQQNKSSLQKLKQVVGAEQNMLKNKDGQKKISKQSDNNFVPLIPIQKSLQSKIDKPITQLKINKVPPPSMKKQQQQVSFIIQQKEDNKNNHNKKQDNNQIPQLELMSNISPKQHLNTINNKQIKPKQQSANTNKIIKTQLQSVRQSAMQNSSIKEQNLIIDGKKLTDTKAEQQRLKQLQKERQHQIQIQKISKINESKKNQIKKEQINHHLHKKQEQHKLQQNKNLNQDNVNFIITPEKNNKKVQKSNQEIVQRQNQKILLAQEQARQSAYKNQTLSVQNKNHKRIFKVQKKYNSINPNSPNQNQKKQYKQIQKDFTKNQKQKQRQNIQNQFYNRSPNVKKQKGRSLPKTQKRSVVNFFPPKNNQTFVQSNFQIESTYLSGKKDLLNQTLSHYRLQKKAIRDPFNQTKRNATLLSLIQKLKLDKEIVPFLPAYFDPTTLQMNALRKASLNLCSYFQSAQTFFNNKIIEARLIKSSKNIYILSILNLTTESLMISPVDLKQGKFTNRIKILNNISSEKQHQLFPNAYLDIRFGFHIKDFNFRFLPFFLTINQKILPLTLPITLLDQCQIKEYINLQKIQQELALYGKIMRSTPFSMNEKDLPKFFGHHNLETVQSARKNVFQSKLIGQCSILMQRLDPLEKSNQIGVYITSVDKNTNKYELNAVFNKNQPDNEDLAKVIIQLLVFLICK